MATRIRRTPIRHRLLEAVCSWVADRAPLNRNENKYGHGMTSRELAAFRAGFSAGAGLEDAARLLAPYRDRD